MKQLFKNFACLSVCLLLSCFLYDAVAQTETQNRNVGAFTKISCGGSVDVYISLGSSSAVRVEAGSDIINDIRTEVRNGTLRIYEEKENNWSRRQKDQVRKVYVTATSLQALSSSGATDVYVKDVIKAPEFKLQISGASDLEMEINADNMLCELSGASDAKLKGSVGTMNIQVSGSSDLKALGLKVRNCDISLSGSSDVHIGVSESLSAVGSGASDLVYKGSPTIKRLVMSGSADAHRTN